MMGTLDVIKIESVDCEDELENGGENVGIDHENIMCRICLDSNTILYNLHSSNYIEAFASVIGIEVSVTDGLPQRICNICAALLQKMARFKEKCLKVHTMLIDAFVKRSVIKTDIIDNLDEIRSLQLSRTKILNLDLVPSTENNIKSPKMGVHEIKVEFPYTQFQTEYDDCLSINNRGNSFTSDDLLGNIDADIKYEIVEKTVETIDKTEETKDETDETTFETGETIDETKENIDETETTFKTEETVDETQETTFETETFDETEEDVIILGKYSQRSTKKKKKDDFQLESIKRRKTRRVRENDVDQTTDSQTGDVLVKSRRKYNNTLFCQVCTKDNFRSVPSLRDHLRVHTGEKPYSCDLCYKNFRVKEALKRHMPVHSDERPHLCQYCDKTFKMYTTLHRHVRDVHRTAPRFQCKICMKRFQQKVNLKRHLNTVHLKMPHLPVATQ